MILDNGINEGIKKHRKYYIHTFAIRYLYTTFSACTSTLEEGIEV